MFITPISSADRKRRLQMMRTDLHHDRGSSDIQLARQIVLNPGMDAASSQGGLFKTLAIAQVRVLTLRRMRILSRIQASEPKQRGAETGCGNRKRDCQTDDVLTYREGRTEMSM